jgi:hypothetical protein
MISRPMTVVACSTIEVRGRRRPKGRVADGSK